MKEEIYYTPKEEIYYTPKEVATILRISVGALYNLQSWGTSPPFIKRGKSRGSRVYYIKEEFHKWMKENIR